MGVRVQRSLLIGVGSAAAFGLSGSLATALLRSGWTPGAAVTVRMLVAAAALTVPALIALRGRLDDLRAGLGTLGAYGLLAVAAAQLCYFQAIQYLSVPVALLIEYSGTVLVVGWMWARHHQVPSRLTGAGAGLAVAGLVLVLNLTGHQRVSLIGVMWGLGAAVGLAGYFVVSADAEQPMPPLVVAWGGLLVGAAGVLAAVAVGALPWRSNMAPVHLAGARFSPLVAVAGLGLVAGAVAYVSGIAAARRLGARLSSFVGLAEVLFAAVYARALLGETLAAMQLAGAVLVVAGVAVVRAGEAVHAATPEIEVHEALV